MNNKIPASQMAAWMLAATIGPILCVIGQPGWMVALISSVVCGILCICTQTYGTGRLPAWLCVLEIGWLALSLGNLAGASGTCWEETNADFVIPAILMIVSALAAQNGADRTARSGATLVWLVLPVLAVVFLLGTADINIQWVRKELNKPGERLLSLLLIPCLGVFLPRDRKRGGGWLAAVIGAATVVASVVMDGVMGAQIAQSTPNTFYEFSKGVSLLGVAERFEALVACVLTGGWFALFTVLLSSAYHLAERIIPGAGKWSVWLCAGSGIAVMCILPNGLPGLVIGNLIFWVFLPLMTQGIENGKKWQKSQNKA